MSPRLYLAGKIEKNDWRHDLVPGLRDQSWNKGPVNTEPFIYVGPFFVSCDHGCCHQPGMHGMREMIATGCSSPEYTQKQVIDLNMKAIHNADLVFAYITSPDCHGTLYELGWAVCDGKRVVVAFAPNVDHQDFWFSAKQVTAAHSGVTPVALPHLLKSELLKTQTTLMLGGVGSFGRAK